ncbi:unnamed protein product [Bathycoccus prasinos]
MLARAHLLFKRLNNYKMWQEKAMVSIYQLILKKIGHNLNTNKMVVSSVVESKRKFTPKMILKPMQLKEIPNLT